MKIIRTLGVAGAALAALVVTADACSTFCFGSESTIVFGKNYDWNVPDGLVMVNPAGAMKTADVEGRPARWTSRYVSRQWASRAVPVTTGRSVGRPTR